MEALDNPTVTTYSQTFTLAKSTTIAGMSVSELLKDIKEDEIIVVGL
jgi:hypothetical protein